jgi:hypothetical protein
MTASVLAGERLVRAVVRAARPETGAPRVRSTMGWEGEAACPRNPQKKVFTADQSA